MRRLLRFALLSLLAMVFIIGSAEAKTKKQKTKKPVTIDKTVQSEAEPAPEGDRARKQVDTQPAPVVPKPTPTPVGPPSELQLKRGSSKKFDLRFLPHTPPPQQERAEMPAPAFNPVTVQSNVVPPDLSSSPFPRTSSAPAPAPNNVFEGLDRFNWGAGSPPDTNGDVGPNDYIQTVNTSIGVYRKSDGFQEAAFTFNTFMSQGNFGNLCDTNNFGDPVVVYDTFENRWIISDFAFLTDGGGNPIAPAYQCFAASMTGDPVSGGWNFYSIQVNDFFNDYPKLGIWPDGLYMSANMFPFGGGVFQKARVWAFNKAQMYAGSPTVKVVSFDITGGDFTIIPGNARLQTGTPPAGRPNLFLSTSLFLNAVTVYKFHVDWDHLTTLSTFTGPDTPIAATPWPSSLPAAIPQPGATQTLDTLSNRAMVQNQYTNFGGTESLWVSHTVRRQNTSGFAAPRWYQVDVTGGNVNAAIPQASTWDPDGTNVIHRWMPSVALDRAGNMAIGYSTSNATTEFPSMKYAGRLAGDAVNTLSLSEQTFYTGTASQLSSNRWGDYSAMTLDPNGCTFWFTTEYATGLDTPPVPPATTSPGFNQRWKTKFGSIGPFPGCTPVGAGGTISGSVTTNPGGNPIAAATVSLGSRSTTTDGSGNYAFSVPAGTYSSMTATRPSFIQGSASTIVVTDGNTTTQNFSLTSAPPSACLTDTTQSDFQTGIPTNVDLNASPGDVTLLNAPVVDQQNSAGTSTGTGFGTPAWTGQTFIAAITGTLVKADVQLFCNGCGATPPNLTLSVRTTSGGLPTGADLATATIPGSAFASGSTTTFTASFGSPAALTSGTQYALILRPVSAPAGSGYFWIRASPSTYANGSRVLSADSGSTWSADTTRDYNFKTYMQTGFAPTGNLVSSPKDSNPAGGITPIWQALSWNGTTPPNTSIKFQVAGSNSVNGPFNFVGPDNTALTFFTTSPVQLSPQFYNLRYIEYKAILSSTDPNATPVLNDVTACFNDVDCSTTAATITPGSPSVCSNSTGNTASGPAGMTTYAWSITNGAITSATNTQSITYTAGASGSVTLNLTITAPNGCIVSGSSPVTINPLPATPTISGTLTFCTPGSTTLFSDSPVGNQWYLGGNPIGGANGTNYAATVAGSYTVQVTDGNGCMSAVSAPAVVTTNPTPPTPTVTPGGATTFCAGGSVTLTSSSTTGNQWYDGATLLVGETNQTYIATTSGNYNVVVTASGCASSPSAVTPVTVNPVPGTPTISGTLVFCTGGNTTLFSDYLDGNQWYLGETLIVGATNQTYIATVGGSYTVRVTDGNGCSSAESAPAVVTVNNPPPTPTISGTTNGTGTQDQACPEQPLTLTATSAGATSFQWFKDVDTLNGETNSTYQATGTATYYVQATVNGCTSAKSAGYVVQNPTPHSPFITIRNQASTLTSIAICAGSSIILDSDSATGIQWYKDGVAIIGAGNQAYTVTAAGVYTAQLDALGCHSQFGRNITVTVNPIPEAPVITPGGPTTFCAGGSVTLTSSAASGNQWLLNGNPIGGATGVTYNATATGSYTVTTTSNGCVSGASTPVSVTVNPIPATPTITPSGPTTFCTGGSVTLTSSSASGNQWYLNGNPIGGATSNTYLATAAGDYTVKVTSSGCTSAASVATTVTINPIPNATITVPGSVNSGSTGNIASVANPGAGTTYAWSITNGTITAGAGTNSITFTAGGVGTLTLQVTVTKSGCADTKSANVTVATPPVTVTSIVPPNGPYFGGTPITINGTGFQTGATVSLGGTAATNVVRVSATQITAKTAAHAGATVNVVVTNPDTSTGTLTNGFTYRPRQFDANGDNTVDPSDIFYLINYLFMHGPAPSGSAGMLSGDANGDGVVDPSDIFYLVNYLFTNGQQPYEVRPGVASTQSVRNDDSGRIAGSITLGRAEQRGDRLVIPVIVTRDPRSAMPGAIALSLKFDGAAGATIQRAGATKDLTPKFEISRHTDDGLAYLVTYDSSLAIDGASVVAEVEIARGSASRIEIDPKLTMLSDQGGMHNATVANGALHVSGTAIKDASPNTPERQK